MVLACSAVVTARKGAFSLLCEWPPPQIRLLSIWQRHVFTRRRGVAHFDFWNISQMLYFLVLDYQCKQLWAVV